LIVVVEELFIVEFGEKGGDDFFLIEINSLILKMRKVIRILLIKT